MMMEITPYACNVITLGFKIFNQIMPLVKIVLKKQMKIAPHVMQRHFVFYIAVQVQLDNASVI